MGSSRGKVENEMKGAGAGIVEKDKRFNPFQYFISQLFLFCRLTLWLSFIPFLSSLAPPGSRGVEEKGADP